MGKFTYLRSRYYIPYEYSYFIKRKNKNIYKYLLFKLIVNILEEMFFSVRAYKLAIKKIRFISRINLKFLVIIRFFIYKFFNFIYCSNFVSKYYLDTKFKQRFFILKRIKNRTFLKDLPYKIYNTIKKISHRTIPNLGTLKKNNSSYILFIRLLLLLIFRRNIILFNFMYIRSIRYYVRKISNYIFFERYNNILINVDENILNFDLRKLILTSVFRIRKYAKRHQFLNKKPILNKISFLIILSTKRFDKLKRPKHNQTFYSYKLQFRQIYKNIYNFRTTKKFNKYIKYVNSKLMNNVSIMQFYFIQIADIINCVFRNNETMKWNIPININNVLNYSNNYYFFSIGDKIEITYEYYKYIILIRKLYIVYIISLIFLNCGSNIIKNINYKFTNINKDIAVSNVHNSNDLFEIGILNNYLQLENLISFFQHTDKINVNNNIQYNINNNDSKNILLSNNSSLKKNLLNQVWLNNCLNIPIRVFRQLFRLNRRLLYKFKYKKNSQHKKFQLLKKYYNNNIQILSKLLYLINSKYTHKTTINYKYKRKIRNLTKSKLLIKYIQLYSPYLYTSNNILYIYLFYKLAFQIINIKHNIKNFSTSVLDYNFLLINTYKYYNKKYFYKYQNKQSISTFYNDNHYYIINNNENSIRTNINSNYFANLYIFTPLIHIYKHYFKTLSFKTVQSTFYLVNVYNLLNKYLNSHYMYMLALYYYDDNICLDFQINFTIIKQITLNLYKNYIISLFMKSYNSIQSSYFRPNKRTESKIKTFLLHNIELNKPYLIGIKNLLFNSNFRLNLKINNNMNLVQVSEISNFFNIFMKHNLLFQLYNWLCDYLVISILGIIEKKNIFVNSSSWKLQQFYIQLFTKSNKIFYKQHKKILFEKALNSFKIFFTINRIFKKKIFFSPNKRSKNKNLAIKGEIASTFLNADNILTNQPFKNELSKKKTSLKLNLANLGEIGLPNFESILNSYTLTKFKNFLFILNKMNTFVIHETIKKIHIKNGSGVSILDIIRILNYKYATNNNIKGIYLNKFLMFKPKFRLFIKKLNYIKNNISNRKYHSNYILNRFYHNKINTIKPMDKKKKFIMEPTTNSFSLQEKEKREKHHKDKLNDGVNIVIKNFLIREDSERSYKSNPLNSNFKSFTKRFNKIILNRQFRSTKNKQFQFKKNQIIEKLYFEYLNNIDYYLNINNAIRLFETHKLLTNQSYLIKKIKNLSLNSICYREKSIIKNYYHSVYSSVPLERNKTKLFKHIISNFKNIKNNYRFNNLLKKSITNYYPFSSYNTKLAHIIPLYTYLKYIKNCLTRLIIMPIYTKLFEYINPEFIFKLENIVNIKTYLHNRSKYFESINFIYNYNLNKYVLENNKLILYSNSNLKTNYQNLFVDIDLEAISTDLRYLFDEKNYISLLPRYR